MLSEEYEQLLKSQTAEEIHIDIPNNMTVAAKAWGPIDSEVWCVVMFVGVRVCACV